jgi:hypothetical protein
MNEDTKSTPAESLAKHLSKLSTRCTASSLQYAVAADSLKQKELKEIYHAMSEVFRHLGALYQIQKTVVEVVTMGAGAFAEFRDKGDITVLRAELEDVRVNALTTLEAVRKKLAEDEHQAQERAKRGGKIYG